MHICLLLRASQLACHTNPTLISWHERTQAHGQRVHIQSVGVARPRERLLLSKASVSHRSIVPSPPSCRVWQISHAEHNPDPKTEYKNKKAALCRAVLIWHSKIKQIKQSWMLFCVRQLTLITSLNRLSTLFVWPRRRNAYSSGDSLAVAGAKIETRQL